MKLIIILLLLGLVSCIKVPSKWHDYKDYKNKKYVKPYPKKTYNSKYIPKKLPYVSVYQKKPNERSKYHQKHKKNNIVAGSAHLPYQFDIFRSFQTQNDWTPILPFPPIPIFTQNHQYQKPFNLKQVPKEEIFQNDFKNPHYHKSPLTKNYRDDKTHEPTNDHEESLENQEVTTDLPTKPIYPGEGKWAIRGVKHKPHITKHNIKDTENEEENEDVDNGYEIFQTGQGLFHNHNAKYENDPRRIKEQKKYKRPETSYDSEKQTSNQESEEEEFVPMVMYAQVRKSETEEHLPPDDESTENGRLKEVVKDSKIHTVYTEEGYEDSAYDHEGHEKEAEDSEGYSEKYSKPKEEQESEPSEQHVNTEYFNENHFPTEPTLYADHLNEPLPTSMVEINEFIKDQETKIMTLKEMDDGKMMIGVSKKVKVMMKPMNDSKTQEHVQDSPMIVQDTQKHTLDNIRDIIQTQLQEEQHPSPSNVRKKRFTNEFPNLNVDTEFIHNINHDLPPTAPSLLYKKYPYYHMDTKTLHKNSPLRYAETLDNVPQKTENSMAFYEQAEKIHCPEVDEDVEAVQKEIGNIEKNVENGDGTGKEDGETKSPRLGKLATKIDCFKRKYFGDNPLDSPFFNEKVVEPVPSIFKSSIETVGGFQSSVVLKSSPKPKKYHSKFSLKNIENNLKEDPNIATDKKILNLLNNVVKEELINVNPTPSDNTGSNILADIINTVGQREILPSTIQIPKATTTKSDVSFITTTERIVDIKPKSNFNQINHLSDQIPSLIVEPTPNLIRVGKSVSDNEDSNSVPLTHESNNPTSEALKRRRRVRYKSKPPKIYNNNKFRPPHTNKPSYKQNVSRISKYSKPDDYQVETSPFDQLNVFADVINNIKNGTNDPDLAGSVFVPKYVKSSEKLNLDLIPPKHVTVTPSSIVGYLNNVEENFFKTSTYQPSTSTAFTSTTISTTTTPTYRSRGKVKFNLKVEDYDDEYLAVYGNKNENFGRKQNPRTTTSTQSTYTTQSTWKDFTVIDSDVKESVISEVTTPNLDLSLLIQSTPKPILITEILGLVPPSKYNYKTIYEPAKQELPYYQSIDAPKYQTKLENNFSEEDSEVAGSDSINNYYVVGMTPPPMYHNIYSHNSFNQKKHISNRNRTHHKFSRRSKRSPQRKSYFEVVRNVKESTEAADDDDYVPHRPKNWHYDEKLKRIVYDKPMESEEEDNEDIEVVEIEVTEASVPLQTKSTRRPSTSTTPLNGPSFVDLVKKLKSKEGYSEIPDPTTKDPKLIPETTPMTTTTSTKPTSPPEFLNILIKLRSNDGYKKIEDKNKTMTKTTTTEATVVEEDDEDSDTSETLGNVQNSRQPPIKMDLNIFDVNDFMPKIKNYIPRTSIDYSKYKTIQRTTPKTIKNDDEDTTEKNINSRMDENVDVNNLSQFANTKNIKSEISTSTVFPVFTGDTPTTKHIQIVKPTTSIIRTRGRKRPTTSRPTTSRTSRTTTTVKTPDNLVRITAERPKRVYPRKRPPRIRKPQTETTSDSEDSGSEKIYYRRPSSNSQRKAKILVLKPIVLTESTKLNNNYKSADDSKSKEFDGITFLENINQLKEVNVDESIGDYSDASTSKAESNGDEFSEEY